MSDFNRIDGAALDRYITGNYGEDQFRNCDNWCEFMRGGDECSLICSEPDCICHESCDDKHWKCPHRSEPS